VVETQIFEVTEPLTQVMQHAAQAGPELQILREESTVHAQGQPSTSERGSMARRRFQKGHVFDIGSSWYGKYREDVIGPDGEPIRKQVTVTLGSKKDIPTKPLAKRRMELLLARINSPDYRPGRFAKVDYFAEIWQEQVLVGRKPSTARAAKSHLRVHIIPYFGKRGLDEIGVEAQQIFVTKLFRANLSRKMVLNVISTLSSILDTAKSWGYVCQKVDYSNLVFPSGEVEIEARFFTPSQVGKIIAAAREPYKTMFTVLAMTGLRAGEMLGLQWGDINFDKRLVDVRRSAWYGRIQTTKNKSSEAVIPLPKALAAVLRTYREQWKPNPAGFLFVTRNSRPPSSNKVVEYGLWPILDILGIPRCGLHAFRHTHSSLLVDSGANPKVLQEQMRHADPRVTLDVYSHVIGDAQRDAVEKVASIVLENVPKQLQQNKYVQ
jgi:integrase